MNDQQKLAHSYLNRSAFARKMRDAYIQGTKDVIQANRCQEIMLYNSGKWCNMWGGSVKIEPLDKNFDYKPYLKIVIKHKAENRIVKYQQPKKSVKIWPYKIPEGQKYHICCYCAKDIVFASQVTKDHVVPLVKSGNNKKVNKFICCSSCNNEKGPMSIVEYKLLLLKKTGGVITKKVEQVMIMCEYVKRMGDRLYDKKYLIDKWEGNEKQMSAAKSPPIRTDIDYIPGRIYTLN